MQTPARDEFVSPKEIARALHVSMRTIARWRIEGRLRGVRISTRIWRFRAIDVRRLVEEGERAADE